MLRFLRALGPKVVVRWSQTPSLGADLITKRSPFQAKPITRLHTPEPKLSQSAREGETGTKIDRSHVDFPDDARTSLVLRVMGETCPTRPFLV